MEWRSQVEGLNVVEDMEAKVGGAVVVVVVVRRQLQAEEIRCSFRGNGQRLVLYINWI